ncbi:zinc finger MYM-type protein 1-like protein [Tanacetum coccineum]|uniref:Zinc finger MYM-type protein 1-like protein n=1 Tax=Tanacetum coccineum TaxID=301880 RepID=A0ABQ5AJK8_9ASTR
MTLKSPTNQAREKYDALTKMKSSIQYVFDFRSKEDRRKYRARLLYTLCCLRYLLHQGMAIRGHDETEESSNRDESSDVSHKEQMSLCLRYVNKKGVVVESFIGVVHVKGTTALILRDAIHSLLAEHSFSPSKIRGQGYDGASNMKGEINGLKTLILKESSSAYYIHFSCKRNDMLKEAQAQKVAQAFDDDEIESGKCMNQELGLGRPGDTRWGSHYKLITNVISLYPVILDVLEKIGDSSNSDDQLKAETVCYALESFDFVFLAQLMKKLFGVANDLNYSLQRKDQDIVEAMSLVELTKEMLQLIRNDGWETHLKLTTSFCEKNGIEVPKMEDAYVPRGRKKRRQQHLTNLHHFRVEVFCTIIDLQLQELNNRFNEGPSTNSLGTRIRRELVIKGILKDGEWIEDPSSVKAEFADHFRCHFQQATITPPTLDTNMLNPLHECQCDFLERPFTRDEIKGVVWDCGGDRAPGPDGFTFNFFTSFWDLIEDDVVRFVHEFFRSSFFPKGCNSSFIALIPKVLNAKHVSDFRPISLIGCQYKIIGKL